jgi:hypothetical protein
MEEEGDLTSSLSVNQWQIVMDLQTTSMPFMLAQKLLEGDAYATISLTPYLMYKVRKKLETIRESPASSANVFSITTKMLQKLKETFGSGEEGTVAAVNLAEGPWRRPKGTPMLALMASLLDPRTIGIPAMDKELVSPP